MKINITQLYGSQIDDLIAEHCMGWESHRVGFFGTKDGEHPETREQMLLVHWANENHMNTVGDWWIDLDNNFCVKKENWHPSTNIKEAYTALRKCKRMVPQHDMHIECLEGVGYSVSTCYDDESYEGHTEYNHKKTKWKNWHYADTLPQAICLTVLLWSKPDDIELIFPDDVSVDIDEGKPIND